MVIKICVGSSCHLKGSERIVELFQEAIAQNGLEGSVTLSGIFCAGKCNRTGVTVTLEDEIYTGITPENFASFFNDKVLKLFQNKGV